ncbi:unnamed protein product [Darwinula stevensoni]|uniref:Uncharacterized protein n=1 Tax=Darwinula stevensoni TaxID=69355 RepID=A0A7R8X8X9_9CRUS|nr:unnamed protein product [Darwinula stevensoni]CAG0884973.1 unnamed protein product [Darwinula stevensoni]
MTTRFSALLLLALLSAKCGPAEGKCPTGDVLPCKCGSRFLQDHHDGEVQLDCSSANTSEEISSASRASWPSSQLWQFRLTDNKLVEELPEGVMGDLSFQSIWVSDTALKRIHPSAILPSGDRLVNLSVENSYNPLSEFPSTVIKSLRKLEEFYCSGCNLGPTLSNGLLRFRSKTLKLVVLWENGISRLGPKDISGIRTDTVVYLTHNKIAMLDEGIFRPTLEIMSQGKGVLHLEGNPVQCGRNLEWLALAPKLLRKVKGACEDGTSLACSVLDLRPCSCEEHSDGMTVDCSSARTSEEVSSAFDKIWPSARLSHFILLNNSEIQELPEGVFGAHSFQNIYLSKTAVKAIHPSAILSSRGQLVNLTVENSRLGRFPFHVLSMFPRLEGLWLRNNSLTSVPAIHSESLEFLYLPNNGIEKIKENGWATPNLREIDLGHNPLLEFPSVVIKSLKKLEKFYCPECHLGPTLSSGLLEFQSNSLRLVSLWKNGISRLEPKAITGTILRPFIRP